MNVFHPLVEGVFKPFRNEVDSVIGLLVSQGPFCQRLHLHEPLGRQAGFDLHPGPFGVTNGVHDWVDLEHVTLVLEVLDDRFPGVKPVHADVLAGVFVHRGILVHRV